MGLWCGMKKIDVLKLAWNETKYDKYNMILVFLLESVLYLNILVLLLLTLELDTVFDTYCQRNMREIYNVTLYNVDQNDVKELEEDGFSNMELCYNEEREEFFTFARIDSLLHFDYKMIKWRSKGIEIEASMQDVLNVIIFIKAIFVFVSLLGILLCVCAVGNFYQLKIIKRNTFINMLVRIGMPSAKIKQIYVLPFFSVSSLAVLNAFVISFPIIKYFNGLIQQRFMGVSLFAEKRNVLILIIYAVSLLLLFLTTGRRWKRLNKY